MSSIIAALVRTTPRRVDARPLEPNTVNVVPRLVEHSAAPAAKACNGVASSSPWSVYERPIGTAIPVSATPDESNKLAFRDLNEVCRPPKVLHQHRMSVAVKLTNPHKQVESTPDIPIEQ